MSTKKKKTPPVGKKGKKKVVKAWVVYCDGGGSVRGFEDYAKAMHHSLLPPHQA